MDAANQQRILGYFIEEAKEHLDTLEKGILELGAVVDDRERVNEMFRAAHSVKGGAAMLGYSSIQRVAHRLEDAFKILSENELSVDQRLEALFLKGYDLLQSLVERLQSPAGLTDGEGNAIVQEGEPVFGELQDYLNQSVSDRAKSTLSAAPEPPVAPATYVPAAAMGSVSLSQQVKERLRELLALFKQPATADNRQQLQQMCCRLADIAPQELAWQRLVDTAEQAIANPQHPYELLAPVVIKELKQGGDALELGRGEEIAASPGLKQLAAAKIPQILLAVEPQAAAQVLLQVFNAQQVSQLRELLAVKA
ncbi:MAG: histidine kinase [Chloroflexaceae bacterium]|nr:histidine kinase [Chloroflexaceae bacterium]